MFLSSFLSYTQFWTENIIYIYVHKNPRVYISEQQRQNNIHVYTMNGKHSRKEKKKAELLIFHQETVANNWV